jgi:MtaA/CmuA family methyltransferase
MFGVPLGRFFADPEQMADVIIRGFRTFGYDGVQLSLGVTAEPEALGARVEQPTDGAPILRERLLSDPENLARLKEVNPLEGGSFPRFRQALERVMEAIGEEAFVIVNLRGPFLMAAQLRGVERLLMDTIESPDLLDVILEATAEVALRLGLGFLDSGAHALVLGEATCSPNFIPPGTYRRFVHDRHRRLVGELRGAGWAVVGLHICGNLLPILEDVLTTGANLVDIDHQVSPAEALRRNRGRAVLRGNLDPSSVFAFGTPETIKQAVASLRAQVRSATSPGPPAPAIEGAGHWIYGSGCDVSPGTSAENLSLVLAALGKART